MKLTPEQLREIAEKDWPTTHELKLFAHIESLEAENARYKEALEEIVGIRCFPSRYDVYQIARKALKGDSTQ